MWKTTRIDPELFEFIYASTYYVSIPCIRCRPVVADIQIRRIEGAGKKHKVLFPVLSALVLRSANQLATQGGDQDLRQVRFPLHLDLYAADRRCW